MDAIQTQFQRIQGTPSTEIKRQGREADHSPNLMPKLRVSETRTPLFQHAFIACKRVNFYFLHFGATWDFILYSKNKGIYTNTHNKWNTNNLFFKSENIFPLDHEAETKII